MIATLVLVLAQAAVATPAPAPKLGGGFGLPKPTAASKARVVVDEKNLAPTGTGRGTLSIGGVPWSGMVFAPSSDADPTAAQRRMDAAVRDGAWVLGNTRHNWQIWDEARREWEAAAENCLKTVGCVPSYKPAWAFPTVKR